MHSVQRETCQHIEKPFLLLLLFTMEIRIGAECSLRGALHAERVAVHHTRGVVLVDRAI